MKRTAQNCTIADTMWDRDDPQRYEDGKCFGCYNEDGALDVCRECKEYFLHEE